MPKTAKQFHDSRLLQVAALPWRREGDGSVSVLLVTSRTNKKWMLPKGWSMAGLTDAEAAGREAFEEAGVMGEVGDAPVGSYAFIKLFEDGSAKPSQAVVYPLLVTRQLRKWPERSQRRRKWMAATEAAEKVFERDLARLLAGLATGRMVLQGIR